MVNTFFELQRLRAHLIERGIDETTIDNVVSKANEEISAMAHSQGKRAIEQAVQAGIEKESANFINQLRLDASSFEVKTDSGELDFSEPPRPQLPFLLKNAKPMKDGSGVYKVIPVGQPGIKPSFAKNIVDEQARISAERAEAAKLQMKAIAPAGSRAFRTATSKQDPTQQWVQPAKDKDFTGDVKAINEELQVSMDDSIKDIIEKYMELF